MVATSREGRVDRSSSSAYRCAGPPEVISPDAPEQRSAEIQAVRLSVDSRCGPCSSSVETIEQGACRGIPGEELGPLERRSARTSRRPGSASRPRMAIGDRVDVGRVEVDARLADDFRQRARPARDHRRAAGHRLDGRQAESFQQRRLHQGIGAAVEKDEVLVGDEARQEHAIDRADARSIAARISGTWVWKTSWTSPVRTSRTSAAADRANASTRRSRFLCGLRPPT